MESGYPCMFLAFLVLTTSLKSFAKAYDLNSAALRNVQKFEKSFQSNDIDAPKIHHEIVQKFSGRCRGLVALKPIRRNEPIIELPLESCLVANKQYSDSLPVELRPAWKKLETGYDRLGLLLLLEYLRYEDSAIRNYIDILPEPETFGTPIHWDDQSLDAFPYSYLTLSTNAQRKKWTSMYDMIKQSNYEPLQSDAISLKRFIWAMESVTSRAFQGFGLDMEQLSKNVNLSFVGLAAIVVCVVGYSTHVFDESTTLISSTGALLLASLPLLHSSVKNEGEVKEPPSVLLPVVDSCNHDGQPNGALTWQPVNNKFTVTASCNIDQNREVCLSYGKRDNDAFLQYFGFVQQDNPNDRYVLVDASRKCGQCGGADVPSSSDIITVNKGDPSSWSIAAVLPSDTALTANSRERLLGMLQNELTEFSCTSEVWKSTNPDKTVQQQFLDAKRDVLLSSINTLKRLI